jgi:Fic family protein
MDNNTGVEIRETEVLKNRDVFLEKYGTEAKFLDVMKEKLAVPFVYNCLSLSGSPVTQQIVKGVIDEGFVADGTDAELGNEILELYDAYQKIFQLSEREEITQESLKGLHKILFSRTQNPVAGKYPAGRDKVVALKMSNFLEWFNGEENDDPVLFAASAYQKFIYIHPFKGGNGKMARLVMNLAALRKKFTLIIIPAEEQTEYERLIKESRELTDDFVNYIRKCAVSSQNMLLKASGPSYSQNKKRHLRNVDCTDTVLKAIQDKPGIKIVEIKDFVRQVSFIKLQRTIADLRKKGLVEFRGALRNGGYYFIEKDV